VLKCSQNLGFELLGIKSTHTSIYHPQTDELVECFNRTLKSMIQKFVYKLKILMMRPSILNDCTNSVVY